MACSLRTTSMALLRFGRSSGKMRFPRFVGAMVSSTQPSSTWGWAPLRAARRTSLRQIAPDGWVRRRAVGGFHPGLGHGYRVVGLTMGSHISLAQSELAVDGTLGLIRHNICTTESVVGS